MSERHAEQLLDQATQVDAAVSSLPDELKGKFVYFQVDIHPSHQAPSRFPSRLFAACGITSVGSRVRYVDLADKKKVMTASVVASGPPACAAQLADVIEAGPQDRQSKAALRQLPAIEQVRMADPAEMLGQRPPQGVWEAVIHPEPHLNGGTYGPASDETVEKWIAWIESLGGEMKVDLLRRTGALTYVLVRLDPSLAKRAISFNPLRSFRPAPSVGPRGAC